VATKNAINSNIPIEVSKGGTGNATLLDNGVLVGSGTAAITPLAVGSTGELLVGASAADPAFGTSATGDFTFTSSTASQTRILTVSNTDNTGAATSAARLDLTVGGANVADPQTSYIVTGQTTWSAGIDNSDSDKYKLSASAALGTTDVFVATTAGEVTMPLQPAFLAIRSTQVADVTGNGATYTVICNSVIFDQNSDYANGTGIFTAPVTGRYALQGRAYLSDCATAALIQVQIVTSNATYRTFQNRAGSAQDIAHEISVFADMDASDTATLTVRVTGEAGNTLDLEGTSGSDELTTFSGSLIC